MSAADPLVELAQRVGLVTGYQATNGQWVQPSSHDLVATLRSYGVDLERVEDAGAALDRLEAARAAEVVSPVLVAWDGQLAPVAVRLGPALVVLHLESGQEWTEPAELSLQDGWLRLLRRLPFGRHELVLLARHGEAEHRAWILSAPRVAWRPVAGSERRWGVFVPTYALRRRDQPSAIGDLADLEAAFDWLATQGGQVVVTLPMLATFLDEPAEISPYAPVSRRFWNELFVDVRAPAARAGIDLGGAGNDRGTDMGGDTTHGDGLVDYAGAWAPRRKVLAQLAHRLVDDPELVHWVSQHPLVEEYARFRAAGARHGRDWRRWPRRLPHDGDRAEVAFHVTAQWLMARQLARLQRKVSARGQLLALDLPLGSHPDGFDVWREGELFVEGISVGAPPDGFFTRGQDWGFPPIHPERSRAQGHAFLQACIRHHVAHAGLLRVDHILGLLRLYWVRPEGGAAGGVYVHYPLEELLAIIAMEAARAGAVVVGENLGTVPPEITEAMTAHGILGCAVSQFDAYDVLAGDERAVPMPSASCVASLNTHDTATFAAFWSGADAIDRAQWGLLNAEEVVLEQDQRARLRVALAARLGLAEPDPFDPLPAAAALLGHASQSDAALVVINVEDGWAEPNPQNVPGTVTERPNWRRRVAVPLEDWESHPGLVRLVEAVAQPRPGWVAATVVPPRLAPEAG